MGRTACIEPQCLYRGCTLPFIHQIIRDDKNDACVYQVYDGATTSGLRLHPNNGFTFGTSPRITLTASSGEMLIRFVTDALHSSRGWNATFSAGRNVQ